MKDDEYMEALGKIKGLKPIMDRMENALDSNSEEDILNAEPGFHPSICEF